jgi:hypothetical protein
MSRPLKMVLPSAVALKTRLPDAFQYGSSMRTVTSYVPLGTFTE